MKNLLFNGMLLLAFCSIVASCAQDEVIDVPTKEMKEVTLTTHLVTASRSAEIQENMELFFAVYNSVTGEVVEKNTTNIQDLSSEGEASVTLTLKLDQDFTYDIAFWAQPKGLDCFDISDLRSIKINYSKCLANDMSRNAYYGNVYNLSATQQKEVNVSLKSPFGKVEVYTTIEDVEVASGLGYNLDDMMSCMTIEGAATVFNALDGAAIGEKTTISLLPNSIPTEIKTIKGKNYRMLAADFVLGFRNQPADVTVELLKADNQSLVFNAGKAWMESEATFVLYNRYLTTPVDFDINIDGNYDSDNTL